MVKCKKKRFSKLDAMLILSRNDYLKRRKEGTHLKRREVRYYFCNSCRAYHLTSQKR